MNLEKKELAEAEKKIGYHFNNPELLVQAFTRASYANENNKESNEVLEFFGDKILSRYIVKRIAETFGFKDEGKGNEFSIQNNEKEGDFTILVNFLVSNQHLAERTDNLDLAKYRLFGKGETPSQKECKPKADLIEAIRGAAAIDSDWNGTVIEIVRNNLLEIDSFLQSWDFASEKKKKRKNVSKQQEKHPETIKKEEIPEPVKTEESPKAIIPFKIKSEIQFTNENASAVLNELKSKHKCLKVNFSFQLLKVKKSNPVWKCHYQMEKMNLSGDTIAQNQRTAKRIAAFEILTFLTKTDNR